MSVCVKNKGKKIEREMERKPKGKRARCGGVSKGLREVTLMCAALVYVLYVCVCVCSAGNGSNWALLPRPRSCLTEASQRGSVAITLATGHSAAGPHPPPVPHLPDEIFSVHVLQPERLDLAFSAPLFYFCRPPSLSFLLPALPPPVGSGDGDPGMFGKSRGPPTHPLPVAPSLPWADRTAVMPPQTSPAQLPCLSFNGHPDCHKRGYFCAGMTCWGWLDVWEKLLCNALQPYREM